MITPYARALRELTLSDLSYESQRVIDRAQQLVGIPVLCVAQLAGAMRDLATINGELMRRAVEKEN